MNKKVNIAAAIEKNRIALLRMVFCWLATASLLNVRSHKPLPRRLSKWVLDLIFKAEKATGYLLIAIFYHRQVKKQISPAFETVAQNLMAAKSAITLGTLTIAGIIKRLKALQHTLHNLQTIARRLAKSIAAQERVAAMKISALASAQIQQMPTERLPLTLEDAVPP